MNRSVKYGPEHFINRELSWLAFDERVLEEARDRSNPLLERVKFAAIAASNLDEFFMVRVAGLKDSLETSDAEPDLAGLTAADQLSAVAHRCHRLVDSLYALTVDELLPALAAEGIRVFMTTEKADKAAVGVLFRDAVLPVLTPMAIDRARPFPLLASLTLNIAVWLVPAAGDAERRLAVVQVPPGLPRLIPATAVDGRAFLLLEDVIREHLSQLFPGQQILESRVMRVARDAELDLDEEGGRTHLEAVEREVRRRRRGDAVRLEIEATASQELVELLREQLGLEAADVYLVRGPLDLRVLAGLTELPGCEALRDPAVQPAEILMAPEQDSIFAVLDAHDILVHHPYDSFEPVLTLIDQAAEDPDVLAIKQTLYRVSAGSPLIASLRKAAERGKQVTVLVEVTARFDEERNIAWARALEEAGAHVIYGVRGYKTHAKICLIVKRTPRGLRRYVHLGTGNYNERTARLYTDFGLMTASPAIAADAASFFNALTGYSDPPRLGTLTMAPTGLRRRILKLIDRERRRAEAGHPAEIMAKMNSLVDREVIEALYAASRSGVQIRLNVRGICALRPGIPDVSANIEVVSIVDRFLEHARVYYFMNGSAGDEVVYLSSADWMTRNLDKRVELLFPVLQSDHKATVINVLRSMFRDNVKARWLQADGAYARATRKRGETVFRVQQALQSDARRRMTAVAERVGVILRPAAE